MIEIVTQSVFGEIATLLVFAALVGFVGLLLRQPLIVSFIIVGLLSGPSFLNIVRSAEEISLLSELGIAVLLFLVGIKLDIKLIRSLGAVSIVTGLGQVIFTSAFGFFIATALGFNVVESLYISVALTFSSTIIIVKLLSDKREIDSLYGQVALGFLIVQDIVVVLAMIVLSAIGIGKGDGPQDILTVFALGMLLLACVGLFIKFIANPLMERLARSPELLITFSISLAAIAAAVADLIGLGKELGGLLAGVALASTPYRDIIAARLSPLRDFLLLFFFIALGAKLDFSHVGGNMLASAIFSVFILIGNPLIVLVIMGVMGFRKRTGFLAGLTVAQISEFSLVFVAMGVALGHVGNSALGLVTMVGLITIAASTYMITYSHQLYSVFEPVLGIFERRTTAREKREDSVEGRSFDYVVLGLGRFGTKIARQLADKGYRVLGVDFNPEAVREWRKLNLQAEYGDTTDPEFLTGLPLSQTKWVISIIPVHNSGVTHNDPRMVILQSIRSAGYEGRVAVTSHREEHSEVLAKAGADLVLEPFQAAADYAVQALSEGERHEISAQAKELRKQE